MAHAWRRREPRPARPLRTPPRTLKSSAPASTCLSGDGGGGEFFAGVVISGGVNLQLLDRVHKAAMQAYRLRFLTVKYGLEPPISSDVSVTVAEPGVGEAVIKIDEMLSEAVREVEATGHEH